MTEPLAQADPHAEAKQDRCNNCGNLYAWPNAPYCAICKTYRNGWRDWFSNFNANGWTAFLAVVGLTVATASGVANDFTDHVDPQGSFCRTRQLVSSVVNGEKRPINLTGPRTVVDIVPATGAPTEQTIPTKVLAFDGAKIPDSSNDHMDAVAVAAGKQTYVSFLAEENVKFPPNPPKSCTINVYVTYHYGILNFAKDRVAGTCQCDAFK